MSVFLNPFYLTDLNGYSFIARNSTSKIEYLPLVTNLIKKPYLSNAEKKAAEGSGTGVLITLLITFLANGFIMILSSGSLEIMWTLLNTLQLLDYIVILKLYYPHNLVTMFSYLSFVNSDIPILEDIFLFFTNLEADSFTNDDPIHSNFENKGFSSKRILINLPSILAIVCGVILALPVLLALKNSLVNCYGCGNFWAWVEDSFKYGFFIRFYMETFLELEMGAMINVNSVSLFSQVCHIAQLFNRN